MSTSRIHTDDISDIDDVVHRAEVLSARLTQAMESERRIDDEQPRVWCAIEYVPDDRYDANNRSFIADIFDDSDPFYVFNNMLINTRARYWTFHFLTTSRYNFNRELEMLLNNNMLLQTGSPESTISLSESQRANISNNINNSNVAGSAENVNGPNKRKRKRTRVVDDASNERAAVGSELVRAGTGGSLKRSMFSLYPWLKYKLVDPMAMVHISTTYLKKAVYEWYQTKEWPISPVIPLGSPIHAANLFSVGVAIMKRDHNVSAKQSLLNYRNPGVYFSPSSENRVLNDDGIPEYNGMYYWTAPHPGRVLFPRVEGIKPMLAIREFPDQTMLCANPFAILYPKLMSGKVATASASRIFSGTRAVVDSDTQDVYKNGMTVECSSREALARTNMVYPAFPFIAGGLYKDMNLLQSKIITSENALRESMRNATGNQSKNNYAKRIEAGMIFAAQDIELAKSELSRFHEEYIVYIDWCDAKNQVLSRYADTSNEFVSDMISSTQAEMEPPSMYGRPRIRQLKPPTIFSISEFLAGAASSCQNYEIFNTLRDRNQAFMKILRPFLDDSCNGLSTKDRSCLYKLYQMHLTRAWSMMARGSDSFLPDAGRATYKYIETANAYDVDKRPRNIFRKLDQDMDILSNTLAWFLVHYRRTMDAARPDLLQLCVLTSYDASRPFYDIHLNVCFAGEGGVAKSWTISKSAEMRIPGTFIEITGETDAANRTSSGAKENWNVMIHHEIKRNTVIGENEGGVGDPTIKQIMDRCVSITRTVILDKETNDVKNAIRIMERIGVNHWCANFQFNRVHNSIFDRTMVINMPPNRNIVSSILAEQTKHKENIEHYQTQMVLHRFIQAVVHEIWMAIETRDHPGTECYAALCHHAFYQRTHGQGGNPCLPSARDPQVPIVGV